MLKEMPSPVTWIQVKDGVLRPGGTFWVSRYGMVTGPFKTHRLSGTHAIDADGIRWDIEECFTRERNAREAAADFWRAAYARQVARTIEFAAEMEKAAQAVARLAGGAA